MTKQVDPSLSLVPEMAKRERQASSRWAFAEPCIWTERMLSALEEGVQGGKWYSLCDKAFSLETLRVCFGKVKANAGSPGIDGCTISRFERHLDQELARISSDLLSGTYRAQGIKRVWIPKPGSREKRQLGIPTVRDRVVQTALRAALEPIFEQVFLDNNFGYRPGRSCHKALSRVWRALNSGKVYVVDADLKACFDTIPHDLIMRGLKEKVSDGKILGLVQAYLSQGVMESGFERTSREGTPQGSVISPLLSNIALHGLDCLAQEEGYELIRYADDFVVLCTSSEEAQAALASVKDWTTRNGLMLHPSKTRLVDYGQGESFDFLGFTFKQGGLGPRKKAIGNLRSKVRDKTPRLSGKSLKAIVSDLNPILRGWWRYFRASPEHVFREGDYFVRKRLRVILDRRSGRKHHHRSGACLRWPNAVFEKAGLISMQALSKAQSSR